MKIAVDGNKFGIRAYRVFDAVTLASTWQDLIDDTTWALGSTNHPRSIEILAQLSGRILPEPPEKFTQSFKEVGYTGQIPWYKAIPKQQFLLYIKELLESSLDIINNGSVEYYTNIYSRSREFLSELDRAYIDVQKLYKYIQLEENEAQLNHLKSCIPDKQRRANYVTYDGLSSATGRMKVTSGPSVLLLKKDYRDVFMSKYPGGKVVALDYTSLEARIALALTTSNIPSDVYTFIAEGFGIPRKIAKVTVISILFGAGKESVYKNITITNGYNITRESFDTFFQHIIKILNIQTLAKQLRTEIQASEGTIRNYYGRTLTPNSDYSHVLVNNYIQSTGVDVCCIGFQAIHDSIVKNNLQIRTLFAIHDCLYLDVHPSEFSKLDTLAEIGSSISGFNTKFYMSYE